MGRRRRCLEVHDAHNSATTTSRGPQRSQLVGDRDWAQALKLDRASSHFVADEARRRLFPSDSEELSRRRWGSRFACASFSRTSLFYLFIIFYCVHFGGFGLCFTVSVKFLFFFSSSTCACVWLLRKCGKEMGIWILVGVLKNLLKYGNVQYLLILIWTLCFQTLIENFNFDSFFFLVFRYIIYFVLFFLILFILLKKKSLTYSKIWTNDNQVQNFTKLIN